MHQQHLDDTYAHVVVGYGAAVMSVGDASRVILTLT
jgi:hypothetical protein